MDIHQHRLRHLIHLLIWPLMETVSFRFVHSLGVIGCLLDSVIFILMRKNGVVHALHDNGLELRPFRIALALFENPQGLETVAPNLYRQTVAGGDATITPAGEPGAGIIDFADKCPVPDIKANNLDGPITLSHDSSLSITIDLDPGILEGQNADWWIGVNTPLEVP